MKKHNFGAGPGILPEQALKQSAEAILDFNGIGMSLLEISHRSKEFEAVLAKAKSLVKELLNPQSSIFMIPGLFLIYLELKTDLFLKRDLCRGLYLRIILFQKF